MTTQLQPGDTVPALFGTDLDGEQVDITASLAGHWSVIQFYRGHW